MPRSNALYSNEGRERFEDITRQVGPKLGINMLEVFLGFPGIIPHINATCLTQNNRFPFALAC